MSVPPPQPRSLAVVLLGQTGNGKSATGNSLLGRSAFAAKRSFASVTERCASHVCLMDVNDMVVSTSDSDFDEIRIHTELTVVDTPGTCDSGTLLEDNLVHISEFLRGECRRDEEESEGDDSETLTIVSGDKKTAGAPIKVHAFVLVLSAASRFTQEEAIALERLFLRIGEKALQHTFCVVTRGEEVWRDLVSNAAEADHKKIPSVESLDAAAQDLVGSAPIGLRNLLQRMPFHADGTPPVLIENFPRTFSPNGSLPGSASRAPILAAAKKLLNAIGKERGVLDPSTDYASCSYSPAELITANASANANSSTAALAMLDRLKKKLVEGNFGGHGVGAGDQTMANAAKRAFEDLAAQFAARAAGVGSPNGPNTAAACNTVVNPETGFGLFGGSILGDTKKTTANQPLTLFSGREMFKHSEEDLTETEIYASNDFIDGAEDITLATAGYGDVTEASGSVTLSNPKCIVGHMSVLPPRLFDTGEVPYVLNEETPVSRGRARVSGRVACIDSDFQLTSKGDTHAVTMHSPVFTESGFATKVYTPQRPIRDDDWVEEGAYHVALRDKQHKESGTVRVVVRGSKPGDTPEVEFVVRARFELTGGSISVQNATFACGARDGDFVFEGTLDASTSVEFNFFKHAGERKAATFLPNPKWPWKRDA